jgi:hypothetical protein
MYRDQSVDKNVVEFVWLGQKVSLKFLVPLRNRATFEAAMAKALGGNKFNPDQVARTIGTLFEESMGVEFGAEGSAVLYIDVPYTEQQRIGSPGPCDRIPDVERQAYTQRVIDWAERMGADEITVQQHPYTDKPVSRRPGGHPHKIRIWWD